MNQSSLTDLPNKALLQFRLQQAILAAQHGIKQVGLLLIDFDKLEQISLDVGSLTDKFFDKAGVCLRNALRESDTIVRLDGGEFAVLLPAVGSPEDAILVARKILKALEEPVLLEGFKFDVRPTVGIALFPEHSTNANNLMQRADAALNLAKQTKNTYSIYGQDQSHNQRVPLSMGDLRQAIVEDQLFVLYQPKIDLQSGRIAGVEVLTRWQHPQLGLISPDEFIPVAERTGLIIPLTLWVLHQSLNQCWHWNQMGIDMTVAVNLSMWNLEAQELPDQISGLLKTIGSTPDRLELEITESAIMVDPQRSLRTLARIRDLGVRFMIDDFGTGYSSLAYLKKLPVEGIKIDKSFVRNMEIDKDNAVIVRAIIDLGHNLGLRVVAEGVESREASEMLAAFSCDHAQGYYYSRPLPAAKITAHMKHLIQCNEKDMDLGKNLLIRSTGPTGLINGTNGVKPIA